MKCHQCQTEMVRDCNVTVEGGMYGIKISKKRKGLFNKVSAKTKAAVCSSCGYVALYIDEYNDFRE
ncbi:nucleic acid-binding protein [Bacillus pinisoli]|uniref:nucleic acid-binding protein n=1 Tax=Bacillus pinisoli TaxID=2901866 RepID=UPI001FF2825B|nr:nucleic acid-binding protein [Bacillus pinisoli]